MIFVNINLDTGFTAPIPCVPAKRALTIMNILSCTAHAVVGVLDSVSNIVDMDLDSLTSIDLCNLLLYGSSQFNFEINHSIHSIIKSTITPDHVYKINQTL